MEAEDYGQYYWELKIKTDENIYLYADVVKITENGDILFLQKSGILNVSFAKGEWVAVYAASIFDGSPVAIE